MKSCKKFAGAKKPADEENNRMDWRNMRRIVGVANSLAVFWPVRLVLLLAVKKEYFQLSIISILWLLSVAVIVRDVRREKISLVSFGIFLTWMVALVFVFTTHYV